jgi:hypothetical protein
MFAVASVRGGKQPTRRSSKHSTTAWWHLLGVETRRLRSIRCPVVYQGVATRNTATTSQEAQAAQRAG